jgi:hypothetical protein
MREDDKMKIKKIRNVKRIRRMINPLKKIPIMFSKLLLAMASTVVSRFGLRWDPCSSLCSFQDRVYA